MVRLSTYRKLHSIEYFTVCSQKIYTLYRILFDDDKKSGNVQVWPTIQTEHWVSKCMCWNSSVVVVDKIKFGEIAQTPIATRKRQPCEMPTIWEFLVGIVFNNLLVLFLTHFEPNPTHLNPIQQKTNERWETKSTKTGYLDQLPELDEQLKL